MGEVAWSQMILKGLFYFCLTLLTPMRADPMRSSSSPLEIFLSSD
uniref:Uncharacterized protein n=1 Tax=Picea sitchensis TaxID=3332 RepID=A0A6B9XWR9_PICSI|nr:hypothetical protein Q903MT_gene5721 [Picea sitchensis]